MKNLLATWILLSVCGRFSAVAGADLEQPVRALLTDSCIACHDGSDSQLNLSSLSFDLNDSENFRHWEQIFDRIQSGEMPPASEPRPVPALLHPAVAALKQSLERVSSQQQRRAGRVILRRLNRTEYAYTLQDMLGITADLSEMIPEENSSGFDTVFSHQGFSPLHVESFLSAADVAIERTIQLGKKPQTGRQKFFYKQQKGVRKNLDGKGRSIIKELDDAIVMFSEASYIYKVHGLHIAQPGRYRIRAEAWGHQTKKPVVLTLNAGDYKRGHQRILNFFDLEPDTPQIVEVIATLDRNEYLFPSPKDLEVQPNGKSIWNIDADKYAGSGVALKWIEVEGPLVDDWPPKFTQEFLADAEVRELKRMKWNGRFHEQYEIDDGSNPQAALEGIVRRLTGKAFRRPVTDQDIRPFVKSGSSALKQGRSLQESIRLACRNVLNAPEFLFLTSSPGTLDDYQLASRLSYFLWKSLPDEELLTLASTGRLSDVATLREQVERMLNDSKSRRFTDDFTGQWLRLNEIDATSPDKKLYPEFDDLLKLSMIRETRAFIAELIRNNLSTDNLIDSDFAMLNRRIAEHYEIDGVKGQNIQKVGLPNSSLRGGLLGQASIMKVTANGTVTSPVVRGSWVLTHLLGTPPNPPPPGVGSVEPDTRGTTTIRETLAKHRNNPTCATCHKQIDPPGFALECFDVIGGFRTRYRSIGKGDRTTRKLNGRNIWEYREGLPVDATGTTADGRAFENLHEFKQLLMKQRHQVARNVIKNLIVYATGAEIQFADRSEIDRILNATKQQEYGLRSIVHEIIQSPLFRNK